jgi:hypothetical protein
MLEFSREYGSRAHPNQRSGLSPQSIPHLQTVDELLMKSEKMKDSLLRIREVVQQQHAAMEDQMKDPNRGSHLGYASETNTGYSDKIEGVGGFANGEGKKRRGVSEPRKRNFYTVN